MTTTLRSLSADPTGVPTWPRGLQHFPSDATGVRFGTTGRTVARATDLSTDELRNAVADTYAELISAVGKSPAPHPVRFWNYLPMIHAEMGGGLDRYMVFNAGRLDGFERMLGVTDARRGRVATASAVGHDGGDLHIHCLSANRSGRPVANPRQVDPVQYSARYGPRPPCFARATAVDFDNGVTRLFVGGTASIRGEASLHQRQADEQIDETLVNLSAVVSAASAKPIDALASFTELRVYHPSPVASRALRAAVTSRFPNVREIEFVRADLCRAELLVEIEGLAEF